MRCRWDAVLNRTRQRRRRQEVTTYDRRLLKRVHSTRGDGLSASCQYSAFVDAGRRPPSCYCCAHCRDGCCPASWVAPVGGGSPLLAPGPDDALCDDLAAVSARTPALYCSCGVDRRPDMHRGGDPDADRKSEDDDDVTPPSGVGDELEK